MWIVCQILPKFDVIHGLILLMVAKIALRGCVSHTRGCYWYQRLHDCCQRGSVATLLDLDRACSIYRAKCLNCSILALSFTENPILDHHHPKHHHNHYHVQLLMYYKMCWVGGRHDRYVLLDVGVVVAGNDQRSNRQCSVGEQD